MENVPIITRSMLSILRPLVHQVELYSSFSFDSDYNDFPCPEVEDICSPLLQLEESCFCKEIVILKVSLRDFYDTVDLMKLQKRNNNKNKHIFSNLLHNVYKFLIKRDSVTGKKLQSVIETCHKHFMIFVNAVHDESKQHLQAFVETAAECLEQVKERALDLISTKQRQQILLCVRQIAKCVPLLVTALTLPTFSDQSKPLNSYVSKRISWCFLELGKAMGSPMDDLQKDRECGGQFVHKMDIALDALSSDKGTADEGLKATVDEVLCHAMSIAHVAVDADRSSISRNCQKVLKALEEMRQRFSLEQPPMQGLLVGSLVDALEHLEQQVNTALLRLVLVVFSSAFSPLKLLLETGDCSQPPLNRSCEDLEGHVAIFDLQMDRIMQIGLFAISCSQDTTRVVCMRSCLASLESLEPELVPALTAYYLEPGSTVHRAYLHVLVQHWREEVTELRALLHGIVDPAAFCEVTLQDVSRLAAIVKANLSIDCGTLLQTKVSSVLKKAALLQQQLKVSLQEEHGDSLPLHIKQSVEDFYFSCNELDAAFHLLLNNDHLKNLSIEEKKRILKRCEILVSMIKRVQPLLLDVPNNVSKENAYVGKQETVCWKGSSLHFPDSVRDLPLDQDTIVTFKDEPECMKNNFTELMKRGKALAKERSILYCTPMKCQELSVKLACLQTPRGRPNAIFNCTGSQKESPADRTLGLDITNILENLTSLSDTLTSARHKESSACANNLQNSGFTATDEVATISNCDIAAMGDSFLSLLKSHTPTTSTFDMRTLSHEVDTLQRIDDLRAVQEKIADLRVIAS